MKWTRTRPGLYQAGPYAVMNVQASIWTASGPDFTDVCGTKADAQRSAERAARARLIDISDAYTVVPVVNDHVVANNRTGKVTSRMTSATGLPLYCIRFARGKRLCLFRNEFKVVMP
jgi:hypothetical protein